MGMCSLNNNCSYSDELIIRDEFQFTRLIIRDEFQFTRYLYEKDEVKLSLVTSIIYLFSGK